VDIVGVSILSGAHLEIFPLIIEQLRGKGLEHTVILAGGIIPEEDHPALRQMGIQGIFGPGTPTSEIADFIRKAVTEKKTE
jgi:methylmalonyl-CoA mutase C-terminal domain/subunit